ncbi:hypothetical protein PC9H_004459 [Pleurotus ostreatus]|uniref:Uncharacterized protein n=1 Tax=Pleurotus ostreatus TaxID=5322 RepID=A0A8H7DW40_PLEOS|nr:uncharacterized protein PC9H_004459 [Pleurotus ostreatus]KAF7432518.1 hypothetical protein PC9H_004459 [Pleurotus ostreatus]KAJ8699008.1 hypothetical protein PTI98_005647 [Pleurotus ostreatus]
MTKSPDQSTHPSDLCQGIPHLRSFRLTSQGKFDIEPGKGGPQDDAARAALANRITQLALRSCGLKYPSHMPNVLTSLSLNIPLRQPYVDFRSMLLSTSALKTLILVESLPWLLPGSALPPMVQSPTCGAKIQDLPALKLPTNRDNCHAYPLSLPRTLRELIVHDRGLYCIPFFAAIDCRLSKLEIQCKADGFNPLSLFQNAARLLLPMPKSPFSELLVRSKTDQFIVQCSRSRPSRSYSPMRGRVSKPVLSIAVGFDDDNAESPISAVYDEILAMAVRALPLAAVRRLCADFHMNFKAVWFRGLYHYLRDLQSITLRQGAIDGFVQTHLWMAQNDILVQVIPFTSLQSVFADWDSRWPRVWGDVDNILRYHNYGGVFPVLFNLGEYAEGFVGPRGTESEFVGGVVASGRMAC